MAVLKSDYHNDAEEKGCSLIYLSYYFGFHFEKPKKIKTLSTVGLWTKTQIWDLLNNKKAGDVLNSNTEWRYCKHCCRVKVISIIKSECVSVA